MGRTGSTQPGRPPVGHGGSRGYLAFRAEGFWDTTLATVDFGIFIAMAISRMLLPVFFMAIILSRAR